MNGPTLVYLHGIGSGERHRRWLPRLHRSLSDAGYPGLADVPVITPIYDDLLTADTETPSTATDARQGRQLSPRLGRSWTHLSETVAGWLGETEPTEEARAYAQRTRALEAIVGPSTGGRLFGLVDAIAPLALDALPRFAQARRYVRSDAVRRAVARRVLDALPTSGDIVLVGHSLGSLVAIDILEQLSPDVRVTALVTLGSPAGHPALLGADPTRLLHHFPATRVGFWVNLWNDTDLVSASRGISHLFPQALDVRLGLRIGAHDATAFMSAPTVAACLGRGLFGAPARTRTRTDVVVAA